MRRFRTLTLVQDASRSPTEEENGGRTRTRTLDPLIKSQLLYQLSYAPGLHGGNRRARVA
jgi:hypothetical protein